MPDNKSLDEIERSLDEARRKNRRRKMVALFGGALFMGLLTLGGVLFELDRGVSPQVIEVETLLFIAAWATPLFVAAVRN